MLPITVRLQGDALGAELRVLATRGTEAMNELACFHVDVLAPAGEAPSEDAAGTAATLEIEDPFEGQTRAIHLLVTAVATGADDPRGTRFSVELAPPVWLLTHRSGYRIFQKKSAPEIVRELLAAAGISGDMISWRLSGTYPARAQTTQYDETEWAFVERLLADEGIAYWYEDDRLVFADDPAAHDGISVGTTVHFRDGAGMEGARSFDALEVVEELAPTAVHVREYDIRQPDVFIEGKAGEGRLEHFEYPARIPDAAEAERRAKARLEQLRRWHSRAAGQSNCVRIQPGRVFDLEGAADEAVNCRYLVVRVDHTYAQTSPGAANGADYVNKVTMVPASGPCHRPAPPAHRARVEGLEPGVVTGPAGEEIHVNDMGEIKVRMPWDRSGIADDRSSTWVRCLQLGMGGSMMLPRVGWEVPIACLDGDPDRPVALGRLYNARSVVPYSLPGGKATSTLQSATSPGGGSTNELRMGDDGGKQEMYLHASKDQSVQVGGNSTVKVGASETHDVGLSYGLGVKGSQTTTVSASQSVNVATDFTTSVEGGRTELIGGLEHVKVTANRLVDTKGSYREGVAAFYGLQCNQSNTDVKGGFVQVIGGSMSLGAGLGTSETVAGARREKVGGSRNITAGKSFHDKSLGSKQIKAGACSINANGNLETKSKSASGKIIVGAGATITAGDPVVISAKAITIEVGGTLSAGALSLSGGALKATKGTTKIEGNIKRQGGKEIT